MTKSKTTVETNNSNAFLASLANAPEAKQISGTCDFSVACRMLTEKSVEIKKMFGERAFSPKQFYAALCADGYTGTSKAVADACWHLAGNLTPAQQKAGQKPVNVLSHIYDENGNKVKGVYKVA